jgi:hypothetical protein
MVSPKKCDTLKSWGCTFFWPQLLQKFPVISAPQFVQPSIYAVSTRVTGREGLPNRNLIARFTMGIFVGLMFPANIAGNKL